MIIKPNSWEIKQVESSDLLIGLSCRFRIANPQSPQIALPLHSYGIEAYQGLRVDLGMVQTLEILIKSINDANWEQWVNIPLAYNDSFKTGYIDLLTQYLGVKTVNLATTSIGIRCPSLMGGDSVIVLAATMPVNQNSLIPDDFLPV